MQFLILFFLGFNLVKDWYKIETEHFNLYYHKEIEDFAIRSADFLEKKAYPGITSLLKFEPERKINIVFGDFDDIGNGFALEIFDQVFVFTADIYFFPLRGRHPWLEDVLTHELTHIIALKRVKKMPDAVPSVMLSGGIFCVLSPFCKLGNVEGKSTLIGSFVMGTIPYSEPAYFTEGIAQLVTAELGYDSLDTYRDMVIRTLFYNRKLYPLEKLGNFEAKEGFEGEIVYNHGFSFLTFIKEKYGWDTILKVLDYSSRFLKFSYQSAFEKATGKSFSELEEEWRKWLEQRYSEEIERYEEKKRVGKILELKSKRVGLYVPRIYYAYQPRPYKDGFLIIQNGNLVFYKDKETNILAGGVQSYSVQGTFIAISYIKPTKKFVFFASIPEEYLTVATGYIVEEKGKLVIKSRKDLVVRAAFPSISPDGKKIVFTRTEIDSRNLFVYDLEKREEKRLTDFKNGKQFVFPSFSPDGKYIVSAFFDGRKQDIVLIEEGKVVKSEEELIFITNDNAEERDPVFIDNARISFSSDIDGVFNLYITDISTGDLWKITEELSGCLFPYPVSEEKFLYVSFEPQGFRPKELYLPKKDWELIWKRENQQEAPETVPEPEILPEEEIPESEKILSSLHYTSDVPAYYREKVSLFEFSRPVFIPSVGLALTPILTSSSTDFFLPLDIFGISLEGLTFDVVGRAQLGFSGFLGMRGSLALSAQIDSFHFENFIPSLILGFSRYRANPISNLQSLSLTSQGWTITDLYSALPLRFPLFFSRKFNIMFIFAPLFEYYRQDVSLGGLLSSAFGASFSASSLKAFYGAGGVKSFGGSFGRISVLAQILSGAFYTSFSQVVEQFGNAIDRVGDRYLSANLSLSLGTEYSLPIGFQKNFSVFLLGNSGYTFRNVDVIDEFAGTYLGYLQVFFGDAFFEGNVGTTVDVWSGYLNLTDTSALHRVSLAGIFTAFNFVRQEEGIKKSVPVSAIFSGKFFKSLSGGILTYASLFYRYSLIFQFIVSHGFDDPLKAPLRIYFGLGIGI